MSYCSTKVTRHPLPCCSFRTIRCQLAFSAAYYYHYFKAAFQVPTGGFLSILAALGSAVPVVFPILCKSLLVPGLIFWTSGELRPIGAPLSFMLLWLCSHLLASHTCSCQWGNFAAWCAFLVTSVKVSSLHRHSDVNRTSMPVPFIQDCHVPRVNKVTRECELWKYLGWSVANVLEPSHCLLLRTQAAFPDLLSFHCSQKDTVLAKLLWVFRSLAFVSREYISFPLVASDLGMLPCWRTLRCCPAKSPFCHWWSLRTTRLRMTSWNYRCSVLWLLKLGDERERILWFPRVRWAPYILWCAEESSMWLIGFLLWSLIW